MKSRDKLLGSKDLTRSISSLLFFKFSSELNFNAVSA